MNLLPHSKRDEWAIPSLDRLLADPAAFSVLPSEVQNAVYAHVATLEAAFRAKMLMLSRDRQALPATGNLCARWPSCSAKAEWLAPCMR